MNYVLKTLIMHLDYYFTEGIEVFLGNTHTYGIHLYDDENLLINKSDIKRFEEKLLAGVYTLYGTSQEHIFQITLKQYGRAGLHITLLAVPPIKTFPDHSGDLDVAWYATVFINLCQGLTIHRMYVGTEELCSQDMKEFFGLAPVSSY